MENTNVLSIAILLFLIMDPFGNMIVVNSLVSKLTPKRQVLTVVREGCIATGILIMAALFGQAILKTLGLEEHALRLAGGIVLFLIALGMLFPSKRILDDEGDEAPLIVPIAMPLIAGPSALSMVILFAKDQEFSVVAGGVLIASLASTAVLAVSSRIYNFLGRRGSIAVERLMGMLLIMISVQMVLDGIDAFLVARQ